MIVKYTELLLTRLKFFASCTLNMASYTLPMGLTFEGVMVALKGVEEDTVTTQEVSEDDCDDDGIDDITQLHSLNNEGDGEEVEKEEGETSGSELPVPSNTIISP